MTKMIALLVLLSLISLTSSIVTLQFMVGDNPDKIFEIDQEHIGAKLPENGKYFPIKAGKIIEAMCKKEGCKAKDCKFIAVNINPGHPKAMDENDFIKVEQSRDDENVYKLYTSDYKLEVKKTSDPTSDPSSVSQSAPSMMIAAFVLIVFLMN